MSVCFKNYDQGYRIVSLALNENVCTEISKTGLDFLYVNSEDGTVSLLPEGINLQCDKPGITAIEAYNNFDVFELLENGLMIRRYNDSSTDNYFFITGKCNSNCIMCPSSENSRRKSTNTDLDALLCLAEHIPVDTPHLTITGGEPFLMGEQIFIFLQYLKNKFVDTEFLFLTNGRVFSLNKYVELFCKNAPSCSIVAIPLHGSNEAIHDAITRSPGSFRQTLIGIHNLVNNRIPVEIRIVVSKMNIDDFDNISHLIVQQFPNASYVSIIAMEMTGTARVNLDAVWIPYKEAFTKIANAVRYMVEHGVNVKLYNFPLCTVEKPFRTLCEKSISDDKVRFLESCDTCIYKSACSGVFAGTIKLEQEELRPIL